MYFILGGGRKDLDVQARNKIWNESLSFKQTAFCPRMNEGGGNTTNLRFPHKDGFTILLNKEQLRSTLTTDA